MATKDRYGNNIRRGDRVTDLRPEREGDGTARGTAGTSVYVEWEDGSEETVRGLDLVLADTRFGRRGR